MATRWLALALVAVSWQYCQACSCMLEHPQMQFCRSDFVIAGRVQKVFNESRGDTIYKVKIRNIYKATPKAMVALKAGRLLTPTDSAMCGVDLKPRETYVITGRVMQLRAVVNLCNYVKKWREITPRQKRGFRSLYKDGCTCKVPAYGIKTRGKSPNTCAMKYDFHDNACYFRHGICLHDRHHQCRWARAPALTRCLRTQLFNGTMT